MQDIGAVVQPIRLKLLSLPWLGQWLCVDAQEHRLSQLKLVTIEAHLRAMLPELSRGSGPHYLNAALMAIRMEAQVNTMS